MLGERLNILNNSYTLEKFQDLETKGLKPKLAVLGNSRLIIYTHKPSTMIDKIIRVFKNALVFILSRLGVVNKSQDKIIALKEAVEQFHLQKAKQTIKNQRDALDLEISNMLSLKETLDKESSTLENQINEQKKVCQDLDTEMAKTKLLYNEMNTNLKKYNKLEKEISDLEVKKESLSKEIERLKKLEEELAPNEEKITQLELKISSLKSIISQFQNNASQLDYKTKYEESRRECSQLQGAVQQERNKQTTSLNNGFAMGYVYGRH